MTTVTLDSYRREDIAVRRARQHLGHALPEDPARVKAAAVRAAVAALREWSQ